MLLLGRSERWQRGENPSGFTMQRFGDQPPLPATKLTELPTVHLGFGYFLSEEFTFVELPQPPSNPFADEIRIVLSWQ